MEPRFLPLMMVVLFLIVVIVGRVGIQLASVGDSGIRPGSRLKSTKEIFISYLMFGTLVVQLLLTSLYSIRLIEPHIKLGELGIWIGVFFLFWWDTLC